MISGSTARRWGRSCQSIRRGIRMGRIGIGLAENGLAENRNGIQIIKLVLPNTYKYLTRLLILQLDDVDHDVRDAATKELLL